MLRAASLGVVALAALVSMLCYPQLPALMAIHWNAYGQADGFAPKTVALALVPGLMLALFVLLAAFARRAPGRAYEAVSLGTQGFMLFIHVMMILVAFGAPLAVERVVPGGVALLFAYIGAFLPGLPQNPVLGVRVPWTMKSPEVWRATHVFAGRLFVMGGLVLAAASAAGAPFGWVFAGFMAMGVLPMGYAAVKA